MSNKKEDKEIVPKYREDFSALLEHKEGILRVCKMSECILDNMPLDKPDPKQAESNGRGLSMTAVTSMVPDSWYVALLELEDRIEVYPLPTVVHALVSMGGSKEPHKVFTQIENFPL